MVRVIDLSQAPRISMEDASRLWHSRGAVFVDVRDAEAYKEAHIPGARSIPLREVLRRSHELLKDAHIVMY